MPPIRVTRSTQVKSSNSGAPQAQIDLQEAAQIRAAIASKEKAPSTRVQSVFSNWREIADQLGDPFERERIPISKLKQIRRDPMIGFGLSFIKVPHVRARWYINAVGTNGPNAQIAAHLDENWRRVHASYVMMYLNCLDFGFQAIAKRFEFRIPSGTYIEQSEGGEPTEQAIWSEGGIEPIAWKPFVPLRPEGSEPVWDKSTGEFFGIEYTPTGESTSGGGAAGGTQSGAGGGQTSGGAGGSNKEEAYKIDLAHSLWVTNEKEQNFGSVFGYPRTGYAYSYWWSYWFRWAIADRAFERKADPSVIVYHPDGEFLNEETGETLSYSEYALLVGERMRSGGVIALPSEVYEGVNGTGTVRQWEIDFTKDATNFDPFDKSFEYLDVQKLRSLFIPEQAFLEGKGGTSSRNVAAEMGASFQESQAVLSAQIADSINRFIFPQWLAANYPEFVANEGGRAEIVIQGFGDEDSEFMLQVIQLIGQQESGSREIAKLADLEKILRDRGMPIVPFVEQQRREAAIIAEQQAQVGPTGPVTPGVSTPPGVSAVPNPTGTGFSYTVTRDVIQLADSGTEFIETLPRTTHYEDTTVKGFARVIWRTFRDLYREEYQSLGDALAKAEMPEEGTARQKVEKLLEQWEGSRNWDNAFNSTMQNLASIVRRAGIIEMARLRKEGRVGAEEASGWVNGHFPDVIAKAARTTRREVEHFLITQLEEGHLDPRLLGKLATEHFSDFPQWKADRIVRTEVRDAYNAGTLIGAQVGGMNRVMALDGQGPNPIGGDQECRERHGKIFTVGDAFEEREHPNGTLAWRIVPDNLSIAFSDDEEGAELDEEEGVLTLSNKLSDEAQRRIIADTVEMLTT